MTDSGVVTGIDHGPGIGGHDAGTGPQKKAAGQAPPLQLLKFKRDQKSIVALRK